MRVRERPRRLGISITAMLILLAGCSTAPSPSSSVATASPAPTGTAPASASASPEAHPLACLDAKLVWADSLHRLLLTNCVDQEDLASVETVWGWDGEGWELLADDGPPANVVTGMAWDDARGVLVRYGGIPLPDRTCSPETWEWNSASWRQVEVEAPVVCDHIELTVDPSQDRVVMVGGGDRTSRVLPGTWAWDGVAWSRLTDAGPPPRAHHGLVTDIADRRVLLYGGYDGVRVFGDLWAWDGSAWAELTVAGDAPGPRSHHGMAVGEGRVLVVGGARGPSTFASLTDETWLLSDDTWSRVVGAGPSVRGLPALGYDADRDVFVLYGGFGPSGEALGDTWEWDGVWECVAGC